MPKPAYITAIEGRTDLRLYQLGDSLSFDISSWDVVQFDLGKLQFSAWPSGTIISVTVAMIDPRYDDFLDGAVTFTGDGLQDELVVTRMTRLLLKVTAIGGAATEVIRVTGRASSDA